MNCRVLFWGHCDLDLDLSYLQIVYVEYLLYFLTYNSKFDFRIHIGEVECYLLFKVTVTLTSGLSS